jgi:hypothetical protein
MSEQQLSSVTSKATTLFGAGGCDTSGTVPPVSASMKDLLEGIDLIAGLDMLTGFEAFECLTTSDVNKAPVPVYYSRG